MCVCRERAGFVPRLCGWRRLACFLRLLLTKWVYLRHILGIASSLATSLHSSRTNSQAKLFAPRTLFSKYSMAEEKLDAAEDMPWVAYGTMENDVHEVSPASLEGHVAMAIEAGARHFDCAELYESTEHVGKVRNLW